MNIFPLYIKKKLTSIVWFLFSFLLLNYNSIWLLYTRNQIEINFIIYALNSNVIKKKK